MLTQEKTNGSMKPIRDGIRAIPVTGETIIRRCANDFCHSEFEVPTYIFDERQRVRKEYLKGLWLDEAVRAVFVDGRELSNGSYISRSSLPCWSDYCD